MADKHGAHQTDEAYVVSLCEDYCKSPSAPVGYMISQKLDMSTLVCGTVKGCGSPVLNMSSRITNVIGNEAGVGGGVISGVNVGMCKPVENYSPTVKAEGKFILRHDTKLAMNCAGPEGSGNVEGKIVYLEKQFDDAQSNGPKPEPAPTPPLPPPRKIGEYTTKNGSKVPVYQDPSMGGSGRYRWNSIDGPSITLGPDADIFTHANEEFHAEADSRGPGGLDGVGHSEDGRELTELENEAGSDGASIEAADREIKKQEEKCDSWVEHTFHFGCYFSQKWELAKAKSAKDEYLKRRNALERASELIKQGRLSEARDALIKYPTYQNKVPIGPSVP